MGTAPLTWALFILGVLGLLGVDLLVLQRRPRRPPVREALAFSAFWAALALLFAWGLWQRRGPEAATQFGAGWLLELSLSVDNLFVFILIFSGYKVPERFLHKALFWGVLGAMALRLAFVALGAALVSRFEIVLALFGALLLYTGARLLLHKGHQVEGVGDTYLVRALRTLMPVTKAYDPEGRFLVRRAGVWMATPLLVVVLVVEGADLVFAVDSIPAVFGVTKDPFIVFTSNVFAILGLRSLFFALEGLLHLFRYLKTGLSLILILIGIKLLVLRWTEQRLGLQHMEVAVLAVVVLILAASIGLSVAIPAERAAQRRPRRNKPGSVRV